MDINTCWETFKSILWKDIKENVPMTCQNKHNKRNFLPNYIKNLLYKKHKIWRLKRNNKIMYNTKYKQLCKQCKIAIKNNDINKMKHLSSAKKQ